MKEYIDKFLKYLEGVRNYSPHTIRSYRHDLTEFSKFVRTDPQHVDSLAIRSYLASIYEQYAATTVRQRKVAIKSFFSYLHRRGQLMSNPANRVKVRAIGSHNRVFLSEMEMELLLSMPDTTTISGLRDQAIMELLYTSAIRVAELSALDLTDLDMDSGVVNVRGKGQKERRVPMGEVAMAAIDSYLQRRHELLKKGDTVALFLSTRGNRVGPRAIRRMVDKYTTAAGIDKHVSPHTFRHTCATHMVRAGADIRYVQEFLGHSSVKTTAIYSHVTPESIMEVYKRCHPRA